MWLSLLPLLLLLLWVGTIHAYDFTSVLSYSAVLEGDYATPLPSLPSFGSTFYLGTTRLLRFNVSSGSSQGISQPAGEPSFCNMATAPVISSDGSKVYVGCRTFIFGSHVALFRFDVGTVNIMATPLLNQSTCQGASTVLLHEPTQSVWVACGVDRLVQVNTTTGQTLWNVSVCEQASQFLPDPWNNRQMILLCNASTIVVFDIYQRQVITSTSLGTCNSSSWMTTTGQPNGILLTCSDGLYALQPSPIYTPTLLWAISNATIATYLPAPLDVILLARGHTGLTAFRRNFSQIAQVAAPDPVSSIDMVFYDPATDHAYATIDSVFVARVNPSAILWVSAQTTKTPNQSMVVREYSLALLSFLFVVVILYNPLF